MKLFCLRSYQIEYLLHKFGVTTISHSLSKPIQYKREIASFIEHFSAEKPDIFFFWKDPQLSRQILKKLKECSPGTKFVMYYADQRGCIPALIQERVGLLDALCINNEDSDQIKMYQDSGIPNVFTLHHCVPVNEFNLFATPITHSVFFGGNNFNHGKFPLSKFRYDLITRVRGLFSTVVYGAGWPFKTERAVPRYQYARALRRAYVNLGSNHYDIVRYYDRRLFECMASGRAHITRYVPGMEKHFQNGKHLVWFHTIKQALDAIQNLLKYPEKREAIAQAGRGLVLSQHSFDIRAAQLKELLFSL